VISCESVNDLLGDYVAGGLAEPERTRVGWHLAYCPSCSQDAEAYGEVIRLAHTLTPPAVPPATEERLRRALAAALTSRASAPSGALDETRSERPLS
jgi:anti-sigma factor RsiW